VVLKKPRPVTALISLAQAIEAAIGANVTTFPSPTPTIAQFTSDINALVTAETAARMRTKGAVQTRNTKLTLVVADLNLLRAYVEGIANATPASAAAIANSAAMELRKAPVLSKNDVNVKAAQVSGSVIVTARVGTRQKQSHEWEYSLDGGKTWVTAPPTTQAKTTITGLTPGVSLLVRHRAVTGTGPTDWTDAASLTVS
jgi:hypothetical protein